MTQTSTTSSRRHITIAVFVVIGAWSHLSSTTCRAAEIRFRRACQVSTPIVTLGHVAQIVTTDAQERERLAAVELFATPIGSREQFHSAREIQDQLLSRGVQLIAHDFSGASRIAISSTFSGNEASNHATTQAQRRVSEAIADYLRDQVAANTPWQIDAQLNESQVRGVSRIGGALQVVGGQPPWTGLQRFQIAGESPEGPIHLLVDVDVTLPPMVVVAVNSIPRGGIIGTGDVQLQMDASRRGNANTNQRSVNGPNTSKPTPFRLLEDVLGKEAASSIPKGKAITNRMVRSPLLVRRNKMVTVTVKVGGITVRKDDRALEDGSLGETIAVESLEQRKQYYAKVSGPGQVEVFPLATVNVPATTRPELPAIPMTNSNSQTYSVSRMPRLPTVQLNRPIGNGTTSQGGSVRPTSWNQPLRQATVYRSTQPNTNPLNQPFVTTNRPSRLLTPDHLPQGASR